MRITASVIAALLLASPVVGQTLTPTDNPLKPASLKLPSGTGVWSVRIIRTGGITGLLLSDITVSSSGNVICAPAAFPNERPCPKRLSTDALQSLSQLASQALSRSQSQLTTICSDCPVTRITLQQRDSNGKTRKYFAFWNDEGIGRMPTDVVHLANTVRSFIQ